MIRVRSWCFVAGLAVIPGSAYAQAVSARAASLFESYKFKSGLSFNKVSELMVPVGFDVGFGRFGTLSVSGGYAGVTLNSSDRQQLPDQKVNGMLDTEARLSVNLVPGKLVALFTGAAPTGTKTVQQEQLAVLGAISSDIIGFSATSLGSGGNVGGGIVGAIPAGRFALGFGATYRMPLSYTPVISASALQPGSEIRLRGGLEGALGPKTYIRFAGIFARSSQDKVGGTTRNGVGTRTIGYLSINHGIGRAAVTAYGFDVLRGSPQIEQTAVGAAFLPRGNLIAAGLRADVTIAPRTVVAPRLEYRISASAADTTSSSPLQRLGSSFRYGVDVRQSMNRHFAVVLQVGGLSGTVAQAGADISFNGLRAAIQFELTP